MFAELLHRLARMIFQILLGEETLKDDTNPQTGAKQQGTQ